MVTQSSNNTQSAAAGGAQSSQGASGGSGATSNQSGSVSHPAIRTKTTSPAILIRHNISDEELGMLLNSNRDGLSEVMWGMFGIFGGSISSVVQNCYEAFFSDKKIPLSIGSTFEAFLCVSALVAGLCILLVSNKRGNSGQALATEIRNRRKS